MEALLDKVDELLSFLELRDKIIRLAEVLTLQEAERTGEKHISLISAALEEACLRFDIDKSEFIEKCRRNGNV